MRIDTHMHCCYSEDAKPNSSVKAICKSAIDRNIDVIALTDHVDYFFGDKPRITFDIDSRKEDIKYCKGLYSNKLELLSGVELGEIHAKKEALDYIDANDFDTVIGSLHVCRQFDEDMYFLDYNSFDNKEFLHNYFEEVKVMAEFGKFDVLAHLDYPLRVMKNENNNPSFDGFEADIEPILKAIIERDIALEINAASIFGWQKGFGLPKFVLDMYKNLGGSMISIGSDSHCADDVGRGIDECMNYAKQAGFNELVYFKKRKPQTVSI